MRPTLPAPSAQGRPGEEQGAGDEARAVRRPLRRPETFANVFPPLRNGKGTGAAALLDGIPPRVADQFLRLCRHEAGHVVAAHVLGVPVLNVSVLPDCSKNMGEAHTFPMAWLRGMGLRKRLRADLLHRLAGPAANAPFLTSATTEGGDFPVTRLLLRVLGKRLPQGAPWTVGEILRDASAILRRPVVAAMHDAVTRELVRNWTLGGAEVHAICRRARRRYRRERRRGWVAETESAG